MIGYLTCPDDFSTSAGLKCCWSKDTTNNADSNEFSPSPAAAVAANAVAAGLVTPIINPNYNNGFAIRKGYLFTANPLGSFTFHIPLDYIFGFAEYKKFIYGMKHSLTLTRTDNIDALFRTGTHNGKVDITDITRNMPQAKMSTEYLVGLRSLIEQKISIPFSFYAITSELIALTETQIQTWRLSVTGGVEKPRWIILGFQTNKSGNQEKIQPRLII